MPTQRCAAVDDGGERCPGVFLYELLERRNGSLGRCPLCGTAHRWDAHQEEWEPRQGFVAG